jgi:hypothetical protein
MADTKISALTALTGADAAQNDVIPIVDISTNTTKKITREEFFKSVDYISFDTTNVVANPVTGQLTWDTTYNSLGVGLNGGNVVMHVGQDIYYRVRNQTGSTIPVGTVVRFAGSLGNSGILLAAPFIANGTYNSHTVMGVTSEAIANNADGLVSYFGEVRGINTSAFTDGQILYASPTVSGGFSATKPEFPNNAVSVAAVVNAANNGTILVRPSIEDIWQAVPATATSAGRKGDNAFDTSYFYVCVATNTWKRTPLTTW